MSWRKRKRLRKPKFSFVLEVKHDERTDPWMYHSTEAWFVRHRLYPERTKTFVFGFVFVFVLAHEQPIMTFCFLTEFSSWQSAKEACYNKVKAIVLSENMCIIVIEHSIKWSQITISWRWLHCVFSTKGSGNVIDLPDPMGILFYHQDSSMQSKCFWYKANVVPMVWDT